MPERLMLTSTGSNVLEVAADKTTFKLLAEIGAAYNYIHRVPNSREDQRELARSQQPGLVSRPFFLLSRSPVFP
jgi:hypothetical protein